MCKRIFAAIVVLFSIQSIISAKTLPKTAKIVPSNTILLIDVENYSELQKQFKKTNFYKFYKEPSMSPFIENVKSKLKEKIGELDGNNIFKTFFDAEIWPEGKFAVAICPNTLKKNLDEPDIIFISQWGKNIGKIRDIIDKMVEKNGELGGHKKAAEDYRGIKIETMVDEKSESMVYCFFEDCFIGSSDPELLKFTIAHIKGATGESLNEDSDYSAGYLATGKFHDLDIFINLKGIIKYTLNDSNSEDFIIFKNLGIENVASASLAAGINRRPRSGCCGKIFFKVNGAKKGICKVLDLDSEAFRIPKFIPSSAYSLTVLNLNAKKVYNEIYNIVFSIDPKFASGMCTPIVPPNPDGQPGLFLKNDIIEHLGSQIIIAECLNKPFSKDATVKDMLLAIGTANKAELEKSLSKIHSMYIANGNPDAKKELLGQTIYLLDARSFFGALASRESTSMTAGATRQSAMPKFGFTLMDNYLIFGRQELVENAIRISQNPSGSSIDSAKWFTLTKQLMPSVLGFASMEDNSANAELLWWLMKETAKNKKMSTMAAAGPQIMLARDAFDAVDFGLLPPFESVKKYFNYFGMYGQSRPDGFFFEFNYLNTPSSAISD